MDNKMYGVRNVAFHFKIPRDHIRQMINSGRIEPKKELIGAIMQWVFAPKDLKQIEIILEKKKAAHSTRAA